jgi:cell division protein ZapA (FtsZ GTPase activity inhibitor)
MVQHPFMNANEHTIINTHIGEQSYALRVASNNGLNVDDAITMVSDRFQAILAAGNVSNPERIAIMVALNIAMAAQKLQGELNQAKQDLAALQHTQIPSTEISHLHQHIGHVLQKLGPLTQ